MDALFEMDPEGISTDILHEFFRMKNDSTFAEAAAAAAFTSSSSGENALSSAALLATQSEELLGTSHNHPKSSMLWLVGVGLSLIASICGILGKVFIKLSHQTHRSSAFYIGMLNIIVLNPVSSSLAYRFAAPSLLAPMGGMSIVWNSILAPKILQEVITTNDLIGAIIIFVGCVLIGVYGNHEQGGSMPVDKIIKMFSSASFVLYFLCFLATSAFLTYVSWPALLVKRHEHQEECARQGKQNNTTLPTKKKSNKGILGIGSSSSSNTTSSSSASDALLPKEEQQESFFLRGEDEDEEASTLLVECGLEDAQAAVNAIQMHPMGRWTPMAISVFAGMMGGQLYFMTATMRLLGNGSETFKEPVFYLSLVGALTVALFSLYLLNQALFLYEGLMVIYLYEGSLITAGAISGICFFHDFKHFSGWHIAVYVGAMVVILFGIWVIAMRNDMPVDLPKNSFFALHRKSSLVVVSAEPSPVRPGSPSRR